MPTFFRPENVHFVEESGVWGNGHLVMYLCANFVNWTIDGWSMISGLQLSHSESMACFSAVYDSICTLAPHFCGPDQILRKFRQIQAIEATKYTKRS